MAKKLMYRVAHYLSYSEMVMTVQTIPWAKIPIVKVEIWKPMQISMDISYYNTLAMENTKLLNAYCQWEPERLPQLGLWIKMWAKAGGIGDSASGYLSSYACIVLLIHYLQQCSPPVLPCLQEDFVQGETIHSSGWNIYFYKEVEPNWSQNTQSVGQLFLGFLDYYRDFNYKTKVVQIRRKERMLKSEKNTAHNWKCEQFSLGIEDPFELNRNISKGVDPKKRKRIKAYLKKTAKLIRDKNFHKFPEFGRDIDEGLDKLIECCFVEEKKKKKKKGKGKTTKPLIENDLQPKEEDGEELTDSSDDEDDSDSESISSEVKENRTKFHTMKKTKLAGAVIDYETKAQKRALEQMDSLMNALYLKNQNFPSLKTSDEPMMFSQSVQQSATKHSPTKCITAKTYGEMVKSSKKQKKFAKLAEKYLPPQLEVQKNCFERTVVTIVPSAANQVQSTIKPASLRSGMQNPWKMNSTDFPPMPSPSSSQSPAVRKPAPWSVFPQQIRTQQLNTSTQQTTQNKQIRKSIWSDSMSEFPPIGASEPAITAPKALIPPRTPWTNSVEEFPPISSPKTVQPKAATPTKAPQQHRTPNPTPERNVWGKLFSQCPPLPSDVAANCPFKIDQ